MEGCGICASDMKCYSGGEIFWGINGVGGGVEAPCIAGHEYAGRVVALGDGAAEKHSVQLGDRVIAEQIIPCDECRFCRNGQYWMCQFGDVFGFQSRVNGGMAKYCVYPATPRAPGPRIALGRRSGLHRASGLRLACRRSRRDQARRHRRHRWRRQHRPLHGANREDVRIRAAHRRRCRDYRLDLARQFGADIGLNVTTEDAVQTVTDLTEGYGCDVYIEASGNPAAVNTGLAMIRKLGTFVEFSVFKEPVTVDWTIIGDTKELNIHGSHLGPYCYPKTIAAIADGSLNVKPLIAESYPLTSFHDAMKAALSGGVMKNIVVPV